MRVRGRTSLLLTAVALAIAVVPGFALGRGADADPYALTAVALFGSGTPLTVTCSGPSSMMSPLIAPTLLRTG